MAGQHEAVDAENPMADGQSTTEETAMKRLSILGLLAALLLSAQIAWGAVPQLINFQGVLKTNGQPVPNGSHSIAFAIYDVSAAGTPLWTETQSVTTSGGHFAVLLGSVTPIPASIFNASDRYLGITVPPDPELSPRQRLASVSFSYRVATVDGATGGTIDGSLHLGASDTLFTSNVSSNSPLRLQTAGTTRMYVDDATGNVGIGTASPLYPLDVQRGGSVATGLLRVKQSDAGGGQLGVVGFSSNLGSAEAGDVLVTNDVGNMWIAPNAANKVLRLTGGVWTNPGAMVIDQNGHVSIGAPPGQSTILLTGYCSADFYGTVYAGGGFVAPSDGRYKEHVKDLTNVLPRLEHLRGVAFDWNDRFKSTARRATGRQIGVIAQEVESEFPELVSSDLRGYKCVDYGKLSAVLLEAVKEQQKEIEALKASVEKMRAERK